MQVQYSAVGAQYKNSFDCARQLIKNYGIRGMYQGITPTLLRNIPANAAYFGVYEVLRRKVRRQRSALCSSSMMHGQYHTAVLSSSLTCIS